MGNLQRFIEVRDSSGVGTIWTCCVTCLAHLAALCHFVGQTEPTLRGSMDDLCDLTLDKLGNISREVRIEEYSHFDVLTGISWKRALDTIDARLGLSSHTEADHCNIGEGLLERRMPIFKQIFWGMDHACSFRWPCR